MDGFGGAFAVFDGGDRQVLAAMGAIAAGPDARQARASFMIDLDTAASEFEGGDWAGFEFLADRLEDHIGGKCEFLARPFQTAALLRAT